MVNINSMDESARLNTPEVRNMQNNLLREFLVQMIFCNLYETDYFKVSFKPKDEVSVEVKEGKVKEY